MKTLIPRTFVEDLNKENINDYLFKVEMRGQWFTTQDVKPFCISFEYRKIADIWAFINWLKAQPVCAIKTGTWEEITEIWRIKKHYKKFENKGNYEDTMVLVWSKEKGWTNNVVYTGGIVETEENKQ